MTNRSVRLPTKAAVVSDFRRAQILAAARRSFARQGVSATTIDHIAKAARVAKGTVYLYYRSKNDILRHTLDDGLTALHDETVPVIAEPGDVEHKLQRFLHGMLDYYDRHREFLELCQFELNLDMRRKARQKFGRIYTAQTRAWQAAIADALRDGRLAPVDARHVALAIVSLAHGLAIQRLRGWADVPLDDHVRHATALVWKGLSAR
jgi:TetR/AcrR family fatty acid metabolism transcriptional regulator